MPLADTIRERARGLGFADARFAALPEAWAAAHRLESFVEAGFHGDMQWMEDTLQRRKHPQNMWPEAKSALVLGYNYGPDSDPLLNLSATDRGNISVYARGDDYHELIKGKLKQLAGWLVSETGCDLKVFVDTAPLMEKPLAQLSGLGWQGKHTNLVSREFGSWLFLGVILIDRIISEDAPEVDHCGSCRACLDICPTKAFDAAYKLDARKCLSYLTIEYAGAWPQAYRTAMGNRIYGCDDCLAVCPWNKFAQTTSEARLQARESLCDPKLHDLATLNDADFRSFFSKSPIKRIGRNRFMRNVHYALGNHLRTTGSAEAETILRGALSEPDPIVRGAAVWGLRQGLSAAAFDDLRAGQSEHDETVQREWAGHD